MMQIGCTSKGKYIAIVGPFAGSTYNQDKTCLDLMSNEYFLTDCRNKLSFAHLLKETDHLSLLAGSLKHIPRLFTDIINSKIDYCLCDKGYTYSRVRVWNSITPKRCSKDDDWLNNILNSINANKTREVTSIRNVIENAIGQITLLWKIFAQPIRIRMIPRIHRILSILCWARNTFFVNLREDTARSEMYWKEFIRRRRKKINNNELRRLCKQKQGWKVIKYGNIEKGTDVIAKWIKEKTWFPNITMEMLKFLLLGI